MPAVSQAQYRWAKGCQHRPRHMRGRCPSPEVAREIAGRPPFDFKKLPQRARKVKP